MRVFQIASGVFGAANVHIVFGIFLDLRAANVAVALLRYYAANESLFRFEIVANFFGVIFFVAVLKNGQANHLFGRRIVVASGINLVANPVEFNVVGLQINLSIHHFRLAVEVHFLFFGVHDGRVTRRIIHGCFEVALVLQRIFARRICHKNRQ